jgi:hypothetical protein
MPIGIVSSIQPPLLQVQGKQGAHRPHPHLQPMGERWKDSALSSLSSRRRRPLLLQDAVRKEISSAAVTPSMLRLKYLVYRTVVAISLRAKTGAGARLGPLVPIEALSTPPPPQCQRPLPLPLPLPKAL